MTAEEEKELVLTPAGFVYRVLLQGRMTLHWWQRDFLNKFRDPRVLTKAALVTPNGSGKSSIIIAGLGLWLISLFTKAKFVICSFDSKQLDHQCWPAITAHRRKFENDKGWKFIEREVHTPDGGFIIGFTTDEPGRAEGWHKIDDMEGPCVLIFDEAKSIMDAVFDAGNRCTYNALGYVSSTGLNEGRFYESCTTKRMSKENPLGFDVIQVGLADCPHIPQERIDNIISEYGIEHPFTRSTLFGEFIDADADTMFIVPKSAAKAAMDAHPPYVHGGRAVFCDFAAGGNENVATFKEGNQYEQVCWRDANVMSSIGRFLTEFHKRGLSPSETYGDAGGMGVVIISRFHELGWPMVAVKNDDEPINPIYENRGAEMAHEASKKIQNQSEIIPNDPILFKQMTARRMAFCSDGRLGQETKKDLGKRGVTDISRWDSLAGAMSIDTSVAAALLDEAGLRRLETQARLVKAETGALNITGKDVSYELGAKDSWLEVWERPIVGRSYLCVLNPVWHEDVFGNHVLIVVRAGYNDDQNKYQPSRLVAKVKKPCRLDAAPLVQLVARLTGWYGKCFTVPIANERGDVIEEMLKSGMAIYSRQDFEKFLRGRMRALTFGWETNEYNRSLWIGALAEAVRNNRVDCADMETVTQLFTLSGANAKTKPDAEALGVALKEMNYATRYSSSPTRLFDTPRKVDLAKAMIS